MRKSGIEFMTKLREFSRLNRIQTLKDKLSESHYHKFLKEKYFSQWLLSKAIFSKQNE